MKALQEFSFLLNVCKKKGFYDLKSKKASPEGDAFLYFFSKNLLGYTVIACSLFIPASLSRLRVMK